MKTTDTHVYFYTGYLSNWHECKITCPVWGYEFSNSEQFFMFLKADFFGDIQIRESIIACPDPEIVKELGRQISRYNDNAWKCMRFGYMTYVNYLKFSQNEELGAKLFATGNKTLVEASPVDLVWGVGIGANGAGILDEKNWRGQNLLGKALMDVRKILKTTADEKFAKAEMKKFYQEANRV